MTKQSTTMEARVHAVASKLRTISTAGPHKSAAALRLEGQIALMGESAAMFREALRKSKNLTEATENTEGLAWANNMIAADTARIKITPRMAPAEVKATLGPVRRDAGLEVINLLRLIDLVCDALADSALSATGQSDAEVTGLRHFVRHARVIAGALGR